MKLLLKHRSAKLGCCVDYVAWLESNSAVASSTWSCKNHVPMWFIVLLNKILRDIHLELTVVEGQSSGVLPGFRCRRRGMSGFHTLDHSTVGWYLRYMISSVLPVGYARLPTVVAHLVLWLVWTSSYIPIFQAGTISTDSRSALEDALNTSRALQVKDGTECKEVPQKHLQWVLFRLYSWYVCEMSFELCIAINLYQSLER